MRSLFNIALVGLFFLITSAHAERPCARGTWVSLGVHNYCAPTLSEVQLMIDIQTVIYDGQHNENVTYNTISAVFTGTAYCRTVEFLICVRDATIPFEKPRDPGLGKMLSQLGEGEWKITAINRFDDGSYDLQISDSVGDVYHLEVDEHGELQYMGLKKD